MSELFSYNQMTLRNLGFVDEAEQARLKAGHVFVCGTGGMGGACIQALVRAGVEKFTIADFDAFEVSNLNRQVFADSDSVGKDKALETAARLKKINPHAQVTVYGREWPEKIDEILATAPLVINGMDDIGAGIHLYRKAKVYGCTVIDAYSAPLPSVFVVQPSDARPEERYRHPSIGRDWATLDTAAIDVCKYNELTFVLANSSSAKHVHLRFAVEMFEGKRSRMSFAPMVITTGNLMAFEAVKVLIGKKPLADARGYFFNPWSMKIESPWPGLFSSVLQFFVRRYLKRLLSP